MALISGTTLVAVKAFLTSKKFLIPAAIIAFLLAVGTGTYLYLDHQTEERIEEAVDAADANATIQTLETEGKIRDRSDEIDSKMDELERQTIKDTESVRNQVKNAPKDWRTAPADPVLVDTINELDRLRRNRYANRVRND